jgi:hypothetical protein
VRLRAGVDVMARENCRSPVETSAPVIQPISCCILYTNSILDVKGMKEISPFKLVLFSRGFCDCLQKRWYRNFVNTTCQAVPVTVRYVFRFMVLTALKTCFASSDL